MEKGKILVVDDQSMIRDVIRDILKQSGHQIATAESGADALDVLQEEDFDVLLTDIMMPGMSGLELVSKVRELKPMVVSVLLTAYPSVDSIDQSIAHLGAYDYLLKPVDKNKLCDTIDRAVRKKRFMEKPV
ncbi:MAG: response regulator [Dehalococcoidia bacterium]|nr:response regulator [Dehalococcoidia bacterium]